MKTIKPIATVSWNTEEFLVKQLNNLVNDHVILFWFYVKHFAESDEKKEHIHLYLEPDIRVDTNELRSNFEELPSCDSSCKDIIRPYHLQLVSLILRICTLRIINYILIHMVIQNNFIIILM